METFIPIILSNYEILNVSNRVFPRFQSYKIIKIVHESFSRYMLILQQPVFVLLTISNV